MWGAFFCAIYAALHGTGDVINYLEGLDFTEPAFVFVIMSMAATRPVIKIAEKLIIAIAKLVPLPGKMAFYVTALIVGPILGSFITEPAAMTVTALILLKNFYSKEMSTKFKYATLGLLFVNISIGGTLSHFAAPPVLMVATKWQWGFGHMFSQFGYKAAISVILGTLIIAFMNKKELSEEFSLRADSEEKMIPKWWITGTHLVFIALVVASSHHMVIFFGLFLFFLGFVSVTEEYQDERVKLKESLLVGFFLGGLVILGTQQAWWLEPILGKLDSMALYLGTTGLTGITDNAALTYLGSLVELSPEAKYYLVAGAVAGGGLTVIANAPNPAGYGILKSAFGEEGISPLGLLKSALLPTGLALIAFRFLPNLW
jgi:hypothetical protein